MAVSKGMQVIAAEAINFQGDDLNELPEWAIQAVIKAKEKVSKRLGYEANLNKFFIDILDETEKEIFEAGH